MIFMSRSCNDSHMYNYDFTRFYFGKKCVLANNLVNEVLKNHICA